MRLEWGLGTQPGHPHQLHFWGDLLGRKPALVPPQSRLAATPQKAPFEEPALLRQEAVGFSSHPLAGWHMPEMQSAPVLRGSQGLCEGVLTAIPVSKGQNWLSALEHVTQPQKAPTAQWYPLSVSHALFLMLSFPASTS